MAGLVPAIHVFKLVILLKSWMAGYDIFTLLNGPLDKHPPAVLIAGVFARPAPTTTIEPENGHHIGLPV
jgi:hypothetical protein